MAEETASPSDPSSPIPGMRRVLTGVESAQYRHRPPTNRFSTSLDGSVPGIRRRSSTLSDFSLNEARRSFRDSTDDLLAPKPSATGLEGTPAPSHWHSAPLAFALLPAIGGMLFQNGSLVVTDIMILGLAAIFLNWSVRLPWDWYHSAQAIRKKEEYDGDAVIDYESGDEHPMATSTTSLDDVPEDGPMLQTEGKPERRLPAHEAASNELYVHELMALLACFVFPLLGAYLLHSVRGSLSRPSEGLVSNYNLTIFLLASELRPMSHLVKLIQARTLHLQRIANANPYDRVNEESAGDIEDLRRRLQELESRSTEPSAGISAEPPSNGKQAALVTTEIRRTIQPELDSLNRAVRRYEKRLATQTMQTEGRLRELESRLGDAISLAAAAANCQRQRSFVGILVEWAAALIVLPLQALGVLASLPFKTIIALMDFCKGAIIGKGSNDRTRKASGRPALHGRIGADRIQRSSFKK